jgi:transposase InsO family protein
MGIEEVRTAPRSPWQNAYVERFIGSVRRECLDHVIVLNAAGLRRMLQSCVAYYTHSRDPSLWQLAGDSVLITLRLRPGRGDGRQQRCENELRRTVRTSWRSPRPQSHQTRDLDTIRRTYRRYLRMPHTFV